VQILIVVVTSQMRTLTADEDKGTDKRAIRIGLVDPKGMLKSLRLRRIGARALPTSFISPKGNQVNIPGLDLCWRSRVLTLGFVCGNTKELEAGRERPRQRYLFCLKR